MAQLTLKEFWALDEKERGERYKDLSDHDKFVVRISTPGGEVTGEREFSEEEKKQYREEHIALLLQLGIIKSKDEITEIR